MNQLADHVILITGAACGIGASVAKACAAQGATIILLDKNIPQMEKVYDDIVALNAATPAIYPMDLKGASHSDYEQLAITITQQFGRLNGLIHCAATLGQLAPVEHQDPKTWMETMHVNLTAAYLLTRACLSLLKQQPSQLIFTTDSQKNKAYWGAYGLSKAATEALSSQLSAELKSQGKVRVSCIDPGKVHTELYLRAYPAADPHHLPKPEDIADQYTSLFLQSAQKQAS